MIFVQYLYIKIKVWVWFQTVNRYRYWVARYRLHKYERSLSPEKRARAVAFRKALMEASPARAVSLLRGKAQELEFSHKELTEQLDRVHRETGV